MSEKLPVPTINLNVPAEQKPKHELIKTDELISYYKQIISDIDKDREEIDLVLTSFMEMVINSPDADRASKEALVNLLKIKSDTADKKTKVMDLLMRAFLKEKDTYPKFLSANQTNTYNIGDKRKFLQELTEEDNKE